MKYFILFLFPILTFGANAQSYDSLIDRAEYAFQQKDWPAALKIFHIALTDSTREGKFDLYYGAMTAVHCDSPALALQWLMLAQQKGLGLGPGELASFQGDSSWSPLYRYAAWQRFMDAMTRAYGDQLAVQQKAVAAWKAETQSHRIPIGHGKTPVPAGFALYYSQTDTIKVPYLVYVPTSSPRPAKVIVYLHGGVDSHADFGDDDPQVRDEPIFAVADSLHALVIYPFARKSFGWLHQRAAFTQVLQILHEAGEHYAIDPHQCYMVGMSNGGSACFWYASQPQSPFRTFLAISALPELPVGGIEFSRIIPSHPLYSVNTTDDEVFPYKEVIKYYDAQKGVATGWHFQTLPAGGHGFIYAAGGPSLLLHYVRDLMTAAESGGHDH